MKEVELIETSRPSGGRDHVRQDLEITLGIEEDHDVATGYVLAAHQVGEAGLADTGGAEHEQVPDTFIERHPDRPFFFGADPVQGGVTPTNLARFRTEYTAETREPWVTGFNQTLAVALIPAKAATEKELPGRHRDFF